jgi:large subunit ribosomal protein L15
MQFEPVLFPFITMALQPCRSGLWRSSNAARTLIPCVRTYATDSTPESFKTKTPSSSGVVPRWSQTPAAMKAPLQLDWAKNPQNKVWTVNNDPKKLDEVYERLLGPGGSKLLPEELKWLAVTHKSFDQGRRGFNDRLALLGGWDEGELLVYADSTRTNGSCHGDNKDNCCARSNWDAEFR